MTSLIMVSDMTIGTKTISCMQYLKQIKNKVSHHVVFPFFDTLTVIYYEYAKKQNKAYISLNKQNNDLSDFRFAITSE